MPHITLHFSNGTFETTAETGETLLSVMRRTSGAFSAPCGGNHTCAKCVVRVEGAVSPKGESESTFLADKALRLACFATVQGDCTLISEFDPEQKTVTGFATEDTAHPSGTSPLFEGESYGVAVDIGTTTIAAYLYNSASKEPMAILGEYNRQQAFGGDVMARIAHANEHGLAPLHETVTGQLSEMFSALCQKAGVQEKALSTAVITGNTTMLHLLFGLEPRSLAFYPFTPQSHFGAWQTADIPGFTHVQTYAPRCISAYIGADIVCGMLACDFENRKGNVLFADIGTNGEIALKTKDGIRCCSTAAGPAFEGAGISCGMGAVAGAISKVWAENGAIAYETIENKPAVGLCGSGLVDAVAAGLTLQEIDKKGLLAKKWNKVLPFENTDFGLTQKDIREFQLAKGAIRGGIDTLLHEAGLSYEDLDEILLGGGFGSFIDGHSAQCVGMLPPVGDEKIAALGNTAAKGAAMALLGAVPLEAFDSMAQNADYTELSTNQFFMNRYIRSMNF